MLQVIKHRKTGDVLFELEAPTMLAAVEQICRRPKYGALHYADLCRCDFRFANLYYNDFYGVNFAESDFTKAELSGSWFGEADMQKACLLESDLRMTRFVYTRMNGANLAGANAENANFRGATLQHVKMARANFDKTVLTEADLTGVDMQDATFTGAVFGDTKLEYESFVKANLRPIIRDFYRILDLFPVAEVSGLQAVLQDGRVDGECYAGQCSCLLGTLANVAAKPVHELPCAMDASRPIEKFFLGIRKGDKPENSVLAQVTDEWIQDWLDKRK